MRDWALMTILVVVMRESFVALAADQLQHRVGPDADYPAILNRKVFAHPTLPIGLGTVGLAGLMDGSSLSDHLGALLASVTGKSAPSATEVIDMVEKALREPVEAALRELHTRGPDVPSRDKFRVYAATVRGPRAELEVIEIRDGTTERSHPTEMLSPPECLVPFYSDVARYPDSSVFGDKIGGAFALGQHLRRVVANGVEEEGRVHGGANVHCGPPIDAVVVSTRGARYVR